MGTVNVVDPVPLQVFTDNAIDTYVADNRELFVDGRNGGRKLRIGDGITPGGFPAFDMPTGAVVTPTISAPLDGAVDVVLSPVVSASAFAGLTADGDANTHAATRWQFSTVADFSTTVWDSGLMSPANTSVDLEAEGVSLPNGVLIYVRVFYKAADGVLSEWSPIISFTTKLHADTALYRINNPNTLKPAYGNSVSLSGDGGLLAVAATDTVYIYSLANGTYQLLNTYTVTGATSCFMTDDGTTLAVGHASGINVYGGTGNGSFTLTQNIANVANMYQGRSLCISADKSAMYVLRKTYNTFTSTWNLGEVVLYTLSGGLYGNPVTVLTSILDYNGYAGLSLSTGGTWLAVGHPTSGAGGFANGGRIEVHHVSAGYPLDYAYNSPYSNGAVFLGYTADFAKTGDLLYVGGSAYISGYAHTKMFIRNTGANTWYWSSTLVSPWGSTNEKYGMGAISEDAMTLVIGGPGDNSGYGSVTVFG